VLNFLFPTPRTKIFKELKRAEPRGAWVAQLVKCPTLDFSSGHDLRVVGSSPTSDSALGVELDWDSFSPLPLPLPTYALFLFKKKKKATVIKTLWYQ